MKNQYKRDFEAKWRQRFESYARYWDDDAGIAGWSTYGLSARLRHFNNVWPKDKEGNLWLDVGCGAGTYTRLLADTGLQVLGTDYSEPTVYKAKLRGSDRICWMVSDVNQLPLPSECMDGVLCFGVIQALSGSSVAISELARVTRPKGALWVDGLNGYCLPTAIKRFIDWLRKRPMHLRYESPEKLIALMREYGFKNLKRYWVPILPSKFHVFQPIIESAIVVWLIRYIPFLGRIFSHAYVITGTKY